MMNGGLRVPCTIHKLAHGYRFKQETKSVPLTEDSCLVANNAKS